MKKIFAANWKLYKSPKQARDFLENFKFKLESSQRNSDQDKFKDKEIIIFPSSICLETVADKLLGSNIKFGSQNSYFKAEGAFTGEISAEVVKELGGQYVLLGHSERRNLFGETDELISQKVAFVQSLDLTPLLCIGELLTERESGQTNEVIERQLKLGLKNANPQKNLVIAYEPVWAIGTGKVATPHQVNETHGVIKNLLAQMKLKNTALLYGGSVKPENAKELISLDHVDGFLIGGASLEVDSFLKIINS